MCAICDRVALSEGEICIDCDKGFHVKDGLLCPDCGEWTCYHCFENWIHPCWMYNDSDIDDDEKYDCGSGDNDSNASKKEI